MRARYAVAALLALSLLAAGQSRALTWAALPTPGQSLVEMLVTTQDGGIYAVGERSGVHVYDARTAAWAAVAPSLPDKPAGLFVHGDVLLLRVRYARSGSYLHRFTPGDGAWRPITQGIGNDAVRHMAAVGDTLVATGSRKLLRSDDAGLTWRPAPGWGRETPRGAVSYGGALLVGTREGVVLRSDDLAETWRPLNPGAAAFPAAIDDLARTGPVLLAIAGRKVYRSSNGGATWRDTNRTLRDGVPMSLIASDEGAVVSVYNVGPFIFDRDPQRWNRIPHGLPARELRAAVSSGGMLLGVFSFEDGAPDDVYRSDDGGVTWRVGSAGLPRDGAPVSALAATDSTLVAAVDGAGIYWSDNDGASWTHADPTVTGGSVLSLLATDGVVLAGRKGGPILRSQDGGRAWEPLKRGPTWVPRLRQIGRTVYAVGGGVWSTRNGGDTWRLVYDTAAGGSAGDIEIQDGALVIGTAKGALRQAEPGGDWNPSKTPGRFMEIARIRDVLYAGPGGAVQSRAHSVFRSADGGVTWAVAGPGSVGMESAALEAHGSTLYAGMMADARELNGGVRVSRDGGETWAWSRAAAAPPEANRLHVIGDYLFAYGTSEHSPDRRIFRALVGPAAFGPQLTVVRPDPGALVRIDGSGELEARIHNHSGGWRWRLWDDGDEREAAAWRLGSPDGIAALLDLDAGLPHTLEVELVGKDGGSLRPPVARRVPFVTAQSAGLLANDVLIAFVTERDGAAEIYTIRPDGSGPTNLTNRRSNETEPAWSPDGSRIAFVSDRGSAPGLFVMDADGGNVQWLAAHEATIMHLRWSPGGSQIAYLTAPRYDPRIGTLMVLDIVERKSREVTPSSGFAWSPDGSRLAVLYRDYGGSDTDGVAVMDPDGGARIVLAEVENYNSMVGSRHTAPLWTPDGTRVLFSVSQMAGRSSLVGARGIFASPDGLRQTDALWSSAVALSPDGSMVVTKRVATDPLILDWIGIHALDGSWSHSYRYLARGRVLSWAPDSSAIALEDGGEIYILTPSGVSPTRLTQFGGSHPAWQPFPDGGLVTGDPDAVTGDGITRLPAGVSVIRLDATPNRLSADGWDAPTHGGRLSGASLIALGATLCARYPADAGLIVVGEQGSVLHGNDFLLTGPGEYVVNFPRPVGLTAAGGGLSAPSRGTNPTRDGRASEPWAFAVLPRIVGDAYPPLHARVTVRSAVTGVETAATLDDPTPMLLLDGAEQAVARIGWDIRVAFTTADGYPLGAGVTYTVTQQDVLRAFAVVEITARPTGTRLLANYPNPFNPETWLPFELTEAADATITIYGAGGEVVRTLRLGSRTAGFHVTRRDAAYWDGRNGAGESVSSGVYYYELSAGGSPALRRMVISR